MGCFTSDVNSFGILELLRDGRARTRSELAAETGLARSTVAAHVEALTRSGYVRGVGGAASTGGRPPSLFDLNPTGRLVAGVDVGATHVTAALADLRGELLARERAEIDVDAGPEVVLGWVAEAVRRLLAGLGAGAAPLAAMGVGLPGPVEHATGRPINPPIMPGWDGVDVPATLQRAFAIPVLVDNDVNIMALGERQAALPTVDDLVFVKVGTGIGAGMISGGMLQRGAQGTAGDLGHVRLARAGDVLCRCGNLGCLEAVAAGPALARGLTESGLPAADGEAVVALVRTGDLRAVTAVRQAGRDLGEVIATLVNLVNPSVVVIGGHISLAGEHLLAGIREVVYSRSLPLATAHLQIVSSAAGSDVAVLGAASLAVDHALSSAVVGDLGMAVG